MDIQITNHRSSNKKQAIIAGCAVASLALLCGMTLTHPSTPEVITADINLLKVEQADIDLTCQAFGEFFSAKEMMLTSQVSGRVTAINLRPGARVTNNSVILTLTNPELQQSFETAVGELTAKKAELKSFELEQQNARLDYQGNIADIEADLEQAQLNLRVNKDLSARGVSTKMDILRGELEVKQLLKRQGFEKKKYQQFIQMQVFQLKQKQIAVEQQQRQVDLLSQQISDMNVTAGIDGSLQSLDVSLGETISQGAALGRVGSETSLLARLRIPEHQADQVSSGAAVILSTRKGQVEGRITRVESVVSNGVVLAEAEIFDTLPVDARPSAPVTGKIYLRNEKNALFVKQTPSLRPRSQLSRFVASEDLTQAIRRNIVLGEVTDGKIVVKSGLKSGEYLLAKMQDEWQSHNTINLK